MHSEESSLYITRGVKYRPKSDGPPNPFKNLRIKHKIISYWADFRSTQHNYFEGDR